jgi:hypothetical protein
MVNLRNGEDTVIAPEEWQRIPLEARLVEHANHTDDELLRDDLLAAIKKLDTQSIRLQDLNVEIIRLERLSQTVSPY